MFNWLRSVSKWLRPNFNTWTCDLHIGCLLTGDRWPDIKSCEKCFQSQLHMPPKTGNCNSTLIQTLPRIQNLPLRPNSLRCLRGLTCLVPASVQPTPLACSFGRCPGSQGFFFTLREASGRGGCFARAVISVPNLLHIHVQKMLRKMLFHAISLYFIELCSLCPFSFFIFGDPYWSSKNWVLPCELVRPPVADPSKSLLGFDVSPRKHPNCHIFSSEKI